MSNLLLRRNALLLMGFAVMWAPLARAAETWAPVATVAAGDDAGALDGLSAAAFVPGAGNAEPLLATTGTDKIVHLWQWREGKLVQSWPGLTLVPRQLIAAPNGKTLASASWVYDKDNKLSAEVRLWSLPGGESKTLAPPDSELKSIAFWPDANTLAVQGFQKAKMNSETVILLYDTGSGMLRRSLLNHFALAFDAQGDTLLEPHNDRRSAKSLPGVARWNLATGDLDAALWPVTQMQLAYGTLPRVSDGEFSSDATRAVVLGTDNTGASRSLRVFQTAPLGPLFALTPPTGGDQSVFLSARFAGPRLLTQGGEGLAVWDGESGDLLTMVPTIARPLAVSPDGRWLAALPTTARKDAPVEVQIWDLNQIKMLGATGAQALTVGDDGARTIAASEINLGATSALASAPDGKTLIAQNGALLSAFDAQNGVRLHTRPDAGAGDALAISPDGNWILTGSSSDNSVRLWDGHTLLLARELGQHEWPIEGVAFSPDGRLAFAAGSGLTGANGRASLGLISIWEVASGNKLKSLVNSTERIQSLAVSPDGKTLANGNYQAGIDLWSVDKVLADADPFGGKPNRTLAGNASGHSALVFAPDSVTLFAATPQGEVEAYDVATGKLLRGWRTEDRAALRALAVAPDGKTLATVSGPDSYPKPESPDGMVKLWDAQSGKLLRTLVTPGVSARSATFRATPQGALLAVGLADGSIKVWPLN